MSVLSGPPERPENFKNPAELREYLKGLNDYFSLVGRPRSLSTESTINDFCFNDTVVLSLVTAC